MNTEEILKAISDQSRSDDEVFEDLIDYLSDSTDGLLLDEIDQVSNATERRRPDVFERLRQYALKQHEGCCDQPKTPD